MTAGGRDRRARGPSHRLVTRAAAILLVLVPASVLAERFGGSVGGRVAAGGSSTPVPSARVTLEPQRRAGPARVALTGDSGEYLFEDVPPGVYRLTVAAENFQERRLAEIAVPAGSDVRVDSALEPAHAEWIIVRGESEMEGSDLSRTLLGRDALHARPAALEDPFRALAGRSGIAQENDFQSQMRIRGGDASDTEVLLDGQPLPYPYHFGGSAGSAGALNGDLVESVEVQTGGFSVEYGDALAGVIDLSTRDRRPGRTTGTARLGSLLGHAALAGPAGEGYWIASGRMSDLGLYDNRVAGDGVQGVTFHDLFAAVRLPLTPAARMEAAFLEAGNGFEADLGHSGRASMQGEHRGGRARLDVPVDPRTLLRVQLSAGDLSVGSSVTGGMGFDQGQTRQVLRLSALRLLGEAHRLNVGLSLQRTRGGMLGTVYDGYQLAPSALVYDSRTVGAFLEDTWRPSGALELRYGLRGDRSSWSGESALSPRVSFAARPAPGLSLRLAAGRFVQFPRQEQIFLAAGEPLRMQTADHSLHRASGGGNPLRQRDRPGRRADARGSGRRPLELGDPLRGPRRDAGEGRTRDTAHYRPAAERRPVPGPAVRQGMGGRSGVSLRQRPPLYSPASLDGRSRVRHDAWRAEQRAAPRVPSPRPARQSLHAGLVGIIRRPC